ncbi:GNAT family N-acetyltransferase [Micromonospora craterilacus]|uniref:GNAT family N-acetyltransferase n=1 Tax=Micromonospora craterilacus TaxID=1655439 RepID=A0A2W2EQ03_9ACTN|nr:GNAT family N-acetyltransferase [Micromonospora craterilacus]PZG18829.1 GNAT family N-acetyltransferase [Micromonospora craterilacus]
MTPLVIRNRKHSDLPGCVDLLAVVHGTDGYPLNWPADPYRWLSPPEQHHAWIAEADGAEVVGHLAVHHALPEDGEAGAAEVARLFVAPAFRRRRVGTALLRQARRWAARHDTDLTLEVVDHQRSPAVALYERDGWRHTATVAAGWTAPNGAPVTLRRYVVASGAPEPADSTAEHRTAGHP